MGHPRYLRPETLIEQFERATIRQFEAQGVQLSSDSTDEEIALANRIHTNAKRQYLKTYNQLLRRLQDKDSRA